MSRSRAPEYIRKRRENAPNKELAKTPQRSPKRMLLEIFGVIGTLASIVGILAFLPRISVDTQGSVRAHDPFGTVFYLSNDGLLSIHDITYTCNVDEMGPNFGNITIDLGTSDSALSPGHKMTLNCQQALKLDNVLFPSLHATIHVRYRPSFIWWHQNADFPMQALKSDDGTWVWRRIAR